MEEKMTQKSTLHCKRKHSLSVKLDQLKTESDIAISYITKILDVGRTLVRELEEMDHITFLHRYPNVNEELDRLVNKVIHLNCCLEISCPSEDEAGQTANSTTGNSEFVLPVTGGSVIKEELNLVQASHFQNLTVPCDIQEGDILDMCYLHGDNPCNFWLRHYSTKAIEEIVDTLKCHFNAKCLKPCENPCAGMYVCVCNGRQFFRAKVLHILEKCPDKLWVRDVDRGETEEVSIKDVYHLDEELSSVNVQCINCCLEENLTDISLWNDAVAKIFTEVLRDSNLVVTVKGKLPGDPPQFVVEVDCHNEGRIISKIELNKWLTSEVYPLLHQVTQNLVGAEFLMVLYKCLDPIVGEDKIQSQLQCANRSEESLLSAEAAGGYVEDQKACLHKLDSPLMRPASAEIKISEENIVSRCRSFSVDYQRNCNDAAASDNQGSEENVVQVSNEGPSLSFDNNERCETRQLEKCDFTLSQKLLDSSEGQCYSAMIAHVKNPGEFYIHVVCAENTEMANLDHKMNEFYKKVNIPFKTKSEAKEYIGSFCAAYHMSYKRWYRGQIVDWNDEYETLIRVKFVDYGDECLIPLEVIQPLIHEFTLFPVFAQRCHLAKIYPVNSVPEKLVKTWSVESINLFKCCVDINALYTVVVTEIDRDNSSLPVLLCDNRNGTCINKTMADFGYAVNFSSFDGLLDFWSHGGANGTFASLKNKQTDTSIKSEMDYLKPEPTKAFDRWNPMSEDFSSETNNLYHDDEDATYVMTGYKPQDEKRVCKMFATKGKCYKGATCLKEHSYLHQDGWTTDKEEVFLEAFSTLVLPGEGNEISLEITKIVNANTFWAIIRDEMTNSEEQEETLLTLNNYLNQDDNVKAMKRLEMLPSIGQIVVAKYRDGRFYRARVIDDDDDDEETRVYVMFVDYGNTDWVKLSDIRNIEQKYLHLAFQAIECVLANVTVKSDDVAGTKVFYDLLHGMKKVIVKVVNSSNNPARMDVLVVNSEGVDVGTKIIERGHGKPTEGHFADKHFR